MKTEKLAGTIESAYGNKLDKAVKYDGTVESFENPAEVRGANAWPSDDDIVSFVNQRRTAAKRQELMKNALDAAGIVKPTLEDPKVQYQTMVKTLLANGKSEADARTIANQVLGTSF